MPHRRRRITFLLATAAVAAVGWYAKQLHDRPPLPVVNGTIVDAAPEQVKQQVQAEPDTKLAGNLLETLPVKGRAPKTGYSRSQFGNGWLDMGNCDMRNIILARDMTDVTYRSATDCTVEKGTLVDNYTGKTIQFMRGPNSAGVQIDHIVAISNAWQTGAQQLTPAEREQLANDPLELMAVDGPANQQKSDGDAATWLPPNKDYRCRYIARQIAVKVKYRLWVVPAERDAMRRVLADCPSQEIPVVSATPQ